MNVRAIHPGEFSKANYILVTRHLTDSRKVSRMVFVPIVKNLFIFCLLFAYFDYSKYFKFLVPSQKQKNVSRLLPLYLLLSATQGSQSHT